MWLSDALFPEFCVRCGKEGSVFCSLCQAAWWPEPELTQASGVMEQHFCLGSYRDPVLQRLLGLWKFHAVTSAREALLKIVEQTVRDYRPALPEVEAVTFVPLHWRKRNERGFDQAEETAFRVAAALDLPCLPLVERRRYTAQQAQIDREQRSDEEFSGVFTVGAMGVLPQRILIVDDVWTTGTTLNAAAASLKQAGATRICALTIAKG